HRAGSKALERIIQYGVQLGIRTMTFYAFSTENWKRPKDEVDALMGLMREYLRDLERRTENSLRLVILGNTQRLSPDLRQTIDTLQRKTAGNTGATVNIAFNYGSRDEITTAVRTLAQRCAEGSLTPEQIDEGMISDALYTKGQPDPDLIVRPSGELRLSNFLLWQAAYTELIFMDILWPDFDKPNLDEVILQYSQRDRRFGGRKGNGENQ
ncbi:MAG: polyprenyl diphosphate synthase, partial [Angelakisella sp.]